MNVAASITVVRLSVMLPVVVLAGAVSVGAVLGASDTAVVLIAEQALQPEPLQARPRYR